MSIVDDNLSTWLIRELNKRSWSGRELARRIGISHTSVSRYIEGTRIPSSKTCHKIAAAFGIPDPQEIMRLAGHLPPLPDPVAEEKEIIAIFRNLSQDTRATVLQMLRSLKPGLTQPRPAVAEQSLPYRPITIESEIAALVEQYPDLGPLFDEAQRDLPEHAVKALIANVHIWIHEKQQKQRFSDLHYRLSNFLTTAH